MTCAHIPALTKKTRAFHYIIFYHLPHISSLASSWLFLFLHLNGFLHFLVTNGLKMMPDNCCHQVQIAECKILCRGFKKFGAAVWRVVRTGWWLCGKVRYIVWPNSNCPYFRYLAQVYASFISNTFVCSVKRSDKISLINLGFTKNTKNNPTH